MSTAIGIDANEKTSGRQGTVERARRGQMTIRTVRRVVALLAVTAASPAWAWRTGPQVPVQAADLGLVFEELPALHAADEERKASASVGGTEVVEESAWGRSTIATSAPIGGLALGPRSWA